MGKHRFFRAVAISGAVLLPVVLVGNELNAANSGPIALTPSSVEEADFESNSDISGLTQEMTTGLVCGVYSEPPSQNPGSQPLPLFQIAKTSQGAWQLNVFSKILSVDGEHARLNSAIKEMSEKGLPILFPEDETFSADVIFVDPIDPEKFLTLNLYIDSNGAVGAVPKDSLNGEQFDVSVISESLSGEISVKGLIDPAAIVDLESTGDTGPEITTYNIGSGIQGLVPNGWSAGRDSVQGDLDNESATEIVARVISGNKGCSAIVSKLDIPGLVLDFN